MRASFSPIIKRIAPFFILGVAIVLATGLFMVLLYILLAGIVVGSFIGLIAVIRNYFFPRQVLSAKPEGRIIEHENTKKD